jgi:hypothetical protein
MACRLRFDGKHCCSRHMSGASPSIFFCINWAAWVLLTELPLYLTDLGFDLSAAGWLSDLPSIANAAGSLVFALIADALIVTERASVVATRRMMNGARALSIIHSSCQRL